MARRSGLRPPKLLIRLTGRLQATVYRASGGRLLGRVGQARVLVLTITGRRSGTPRTVPLLFIPDGERFVIVASQGGHDTHPAWYLNLRAHPDATVRIGARVMPVTARDADAAEAERVWPELVAVYSRWEEYRLRTTRRFPIVFLSPR